MDGRPGPVAERPAASASRRQWRSIGNSSSRSRSSSSSRARSSGNSRTSTGNNPSHSDSTCEAPNVSTGTPLIDQEPAHLQEILEVEPDGTVALSGDYFRGKELGGLPGPGPHPIQAAVASSNRSADAI